jgi:anti-anti-sigma factor
MAQGSLRYHVAMQFKAQRNAGVLVISPEGRLDAGSCERFETEMLGALDSSDKLVLVDCSKLSFVASAGLRVFLMAAKRLRISGGRLAFAGLQRDVEQVFQISGFNALFAIHKTVADAEKALAAR